MLVQEFAQRLNPLSGDLCQIGIPDHIVMVNLDIVLLSVWWRFR